MRVEEREGVGRGGMRRERGWGLVLNWDDKRQNHDKETK